MPKFIDDAVCLYEIVPALFLHRPRHDDGT